MVVEIATVLKDGSHHAAEKLCKYCIEALFCVYVNFL